jgi:formate--tetrahydrofolate ligase
MGLIEGLGYQKENVGGAIRQPSGGPTMNVKGTAAAAVTPCSYRTPSSPLGLTAISMTL